MAVDEALARNYRQQNVTLRAAALREAARLWPLLDVRRMDATFADWLAAHAALIRRDHRRAAGLAATYLRAARLSSGVPGEPTLSLAADIPAGQIEAAMSATARAGFYTALRAGRTVEQAADVALVRSLGATGRLVLLGGRETVRASLRRDRRGAGWQRVTGAGACDWCVMLAGRGAVYSADTVDFNAHDHCGCTAAAVYSDRPLPILTALPALAAA